MMAATKSPKYVTQNQLENLIDQINAQTDHIIASVGAIVTEQVTRLDKRIEGLGHKLTKTSERIERLEQDTKIVYLRTSTLAHNFEVLKIRTEKADNQLETIIKLLKEKL